MPATKKPRASGISEQPTKKALEITLSANRIATNKPGVNPYELRNDVLIEEEKSRICSENGLDAARSRAGRLAPTRGTTPRA